MFSCFCFGLSSKPSKSPKTNDSSASPQSQPHNKSLTNQQVQPEHESTTKNVDPKDCIFSKRGYGERCVKTPGSLPPNVAFIVEDCQSADIFILTPTSQVTIDNCEGCVIFIAPTSGAIFLRNCTDCQVFALSHQLRLKECRNLKCSLYVLTGPTLEECNGLSFSPLDINLIQYPEISEQLKIAEMHGVSKEGSARAVMNEWDKVYDFSPTRTPSGVSGGELKNWKLTSNPSSMVLPTFPTVASIQSYD